MEPFTRLTSTVAVLPEPDIDTDVIFPARFLLITAKTGLGRYAFHERRYENGAERADFPLNREPGRSARILIAGDNFGCGSSREQAVWALHDLGMRCIISTRFGEIFHGNCFKSGVLPIVLPADQIAELIARTGDGAPLTVDLKSRTVTPPDGRAIGFQIEDGRREALLNGWDDVLIILNTRADAIAAFEDRQRALSPWLYAAG